jgi:hypothetical protein
VDVFQIDYDIKDVFSPHHHRHNMNNKNYSNTKGNKQWELSSKHIVTKSIIFNELCPIWSKKYL